MYQNIFNSGRQPTLSTQKIEHPNGWRSILWALAAIALLLFPLFMINSLVQAAMDVSSDAFPIRQCFVRDRINKITNNEMVARFDGLNQGGTPETIYFSASELKWVEYSDGSARLMGDMIAIGGGVGFTVDVTFTNKAIANGNLEYDSFFGTLTGLGDYAGAELSVQAGAKTPSFRFWNNGPDAEGWMQWVVTSQSTGGELITEAGQSGVWSFSINPNCTKVSYLVYVEEPDNKEFIAPGSDSDVDPGRATEVDAGIVNEGGEITGVVWNINRDGPRDKDKPEVEGVQVELISKDGNTVYMTDTTGPDGSYALPIENSKISYRVRFTTPDVNENANDDIDSDPDTRTGEAANITVPTGSIIDNVDPGLISRTKPDDCGGGKLFISAGHYGNNRLISNFEHNVQDSTILIELFNNSNRPILLGEIHSITKSGIVEVSAYIDDVYYVIWKDDNGNGLRDADEPTLSGITINLLTKAGEVMTTTETNEDGTYSFDGIDTTVSYIVEVVPPAHKEFTDSGRDSDVDPTTGRSEFVTVDPDGIAPVSAGLRNKPGTVNGRVWKDINGNGIQDDGEPGVEDVAVGLVLEDETLAVKTTTTDADGNYSLPVDDPKTKYCIRVIKPAAQYFTAQGTPAIDVDDAGDSDVATDNGQTEPFRVPANDSVYNVDAGVKCSKVCGVVFKDEDDDGKHSSGEETLGGITVNLLAKDGTLIAATETVKDGTYIFPGVDSTMSYVVEFELPADKLFTTPGEDSDVDPTTGKSPSVVIPDNGIVNVSAGMVNKSGMIGDTVFKDDNENGIQDAGEGGIEGVTVRLLDSAGAEVGVATTDANGVYKFTVGPKQSYVIEVVEPEGYNFSPKNAPGSTPLNDSDVDPTTGQTGPISVGPDEGDTSIDAGLVWELGTIVGTIWKDNNKDGIQGADEPSILGATVILQTSDGTIIATTTTDEKGNYSFPGLESGDYIAVSEAPEGMTLTQQDVGDDDTVDSEFDPETSKTNIIAVFAGETTGNVNAGLISAPQAEPGNVSCDGTVNSVDALFILQYDVGLREGSDQCPEVRQVQMLYVPACDINGDDICGAVDALFILRCDVGLTNAFCPQ